MRNIAVILLALAAAAHADKVTRAVQKAGYRHAIVEARGKVWLVDAVARDGSGHGLLVEPARGKVVDAGAPFGYLAAGNDAHIEVAVAAFLGRKELWDVTMSSGGDPWHYVLRVPRFELACQFAGSSSAGAPMTIAKTNDDPLTWTMTPQAAADQSVAAAIAGADRIITYTLGAKGTCTER